MSLLNPRKLQALVNGLLPKNGAPMFLYDADRDAVLITRCRFLASTGAYVHGYLPSNMYTAPSLWKEWELNKENNLCLLSL